MIFGFFLHDIQIEAIWTLFYKQKNLFLIIKIRFRKNLIFQFFLFIMLA